LAKHALGFAEFTDDGTSAQIAKRLQSPAFNCWHDDPFEHGKRRRVIDAIAEGLV
jgi:hypothetical protein